MKFSYVFNKTAIHIAIEKQNLEIIRLLLAQKGINVNIMSILKTKIIIQFLSLIFKFS